MIEIKDMEMPRSCFCCPFSKKGSILDGGYFCILQNLDGEIITYAKSQYKINGEFKDKQGCPLVEIEERKVGEINWIPLVWDEYPTVDMDGNDDYVYAVDYSVPMPKEDEWVLITDENHNVRTVQYDGYDFGDYVREEILAWAHSPMPYKD